MKAAVLPILLIMIASVATALPQLWTDKGEVIIKADDLRLRLDNVSACSIVHAHESTMFVLYIFFYNYLKKGMFYHLYP